MKVVKLILLHEENESISANANFKDDTEVITNDIDKESFLSNEGI